MKCAEVAEMVRLWEDGGNAGIDADNPAAFLSHLETCSACKKRYGGLAFFIGRENHTHPEEKGKAGFADSVMRKIREAEGKKSLPFAVPVVRYARFAAAALLLVIFAAGFAYRGTVPVHFTFNAPDADSVVLVGSFPGWSAEAGRTMTRKPGGKWELTVRLRRSGVYTYNFLVDGTEWVPDPSAVEAVDDGFGGLNSLIRL